MSINRISFSLLYVHRENINRILESTYKTSDLAGITSPSITTTFSYVSDARVILPMFVIFFDSYRLPPSLYNLFALFGRKSFLFIR